MDKKRGVMSLWIMFVCMAIIGFSGVTYAADAIIDNNAAGATSSGAWQNSSGTGYYGTVSEYSNEAGATYYYSATVTGLQEVSMRWTYWGNRCTSVDVDIYDGDDTTSTPRLVPSSNVVIL